MPVIIQKNNSKPTNPNFSTNDFLDNLDALPVPESLPETNSARQNLPPCGNGKSVEATHTKGAFITQKGENFDHYKDAHSIEELEALVSGISQTSQDTLLLRKKKEMREWSEALTKEKEIFKKRMDQCEIRKQAFQKEKQAMRDQVLKFEKFILENDAKRRKAERKRKNEINEIKNKKQDYETKHKKLLEYEHAKKELIKKLKSLSRFRHYLDSVLLEGDNKTFEEVNDLLNRLNTLQKLHVDLTQRQQDLEEEADEVRLKFSNLQLETQNKLLMESSTFYSSQKILKDLSSVNTKRLHNKNTEQKMQQDMQRGIGQILMAIKNLYFRCLATEGYSSIPRLKVPKGVEISQIQELDFYLKAVMGRINDLAEIDKEYNAYATMKLQKKKDKASEEEEDVANLPATTVGQSTGAGGNAPAQTASDNSINVTSEK